MPSLARRPTARLASAPVVSFHRGHKPQPQQPQQPLSKPRQPRSDDLNERKWDAGRDMQLAVRYHRPTVYDHRICAWEGHWAPYNAATDKHSKKWVQRQMEQAHHERRRTPGKQPPLSARPPPASMPPRATLQRGPQYFLQRQREAPASSVPRSTLYRHQP